MGENVGYGYSSAGALVKAWIKSEGHSKIWRVPIIILAYLPGKGENVELMSL